MDQGFTKPNRNAASWDSDINANFTLLERGYVVPFVVGSQSVNTGTLVNIVSAGVNSYGVGNYHAPNGTGLVGLLPDLLCLQAGSPGNLVYGLSHGAINNFGPYSGQLSKGTFFTTSVLTPGWVSNCFDLGGMLTLGRVISDDIIFFNPNATTQRQFSRIVSGMAHAASGELSTFSFHLNNLGTYGFGAYLRVLSNSCDNYRITIYANSERSTIIYDTAINSGNLGVRTRDMIDASLFVYSLTGTDVTSLWGSLHGRLEVLSSAATAINSQNFSVTLAGMRIR